MVYVKSQNTHSETWSDKNIKVNNSGDKTKTRNNKNKNSQGKNKESPCTSQGVMILCQYTAFVVIPKPI